MKPSQTCKIYNMNYYRKKKYKSQMLSLFFKKMMFMKQAIVCLIALTVLNMISANADYQMQHDTQKVQEMGYTM